MALSKIQAESMNLADTYAFTGTVSGASDFVKLSTVDASNDNTINFDNTIVASPYVNFILKYSRMVVQTDQTKFDFFLSSNNGSSFTGNTKLGEVYRNFNTSGSGPQQDSGSNNARIQLGYQDDSTNGASGFIMINGLRSSGYTFVHYNHAYFHGGGSDFYQLNGGAVFENNSVFNYIRLQSSSGQIVSGKFTLYGEKA